MKSRVLRAGLALAVTLIFTAVAGCGNDAYYRVGKINSEQKYNIKLTGGYFFGPGPIVPDTALPDGNLSNVNFDPLRLEGYTEFFNDGSDAGKLSDGKTKINQNIEAGRLNIGDGSRPVLLVAVKGGRNNGREYYYLDEHYRLVWRVDLALDPGFPEGIIRVNDFVLHTGVIKIAPSLQTLNGIPGGYDQAGSLESGQHIAGRVGDFDQDGFLDGILVAAPHVPLDSAMLPGVPVGNQRGFKTDIELPPHLAAELALRGVALFEEPLIDIIARNDIAELKKILRDIEIRMTAIQGNIDRALAVGAWRSVEIRNKGALFANRLASIKELNSSVIGYFREAQNPKNNIPDSVSNAVREMFVQVNSLIPGVSETNQLAGRALPKRTALAVLSHHEKSKDILKRG